MQILNARLPKPVLAVSFGENGQAIAIAARNELSLHHLATGEVRTLDTPLSRLFAMQCQPQSSRIVISPFNLEIYDASASPIQRIVVPELSGTFSNSFCVSADGRYLVNSQNGIQNNSINCWSIDSKGGFQRIWSIPSTMSLAGSVGHETILSAIALRPFDGRMATDPAISRDSRLTAYRNSTSARFLGGIDPEQIMIRRIEDGSELSRFVVPDLDFGLDFRLFFLPDNEYLMGVTHREMVVWDTLDGAEMKRVVYPGRGNIAGIKFHPSGDFFITVGGDRLTRYWDAKSFKITKTLKWDIGKLTCLDICPDGSMAVAGSDTGQVIVWDI